MKREVVLKNMAIYYVKAMVFAVGSYWLVLLIYGRTKITFFEWAVVILVAFTIGYIPYFIKLLREK